MAYKYSNVSKPMTLTSGINTSDVTIVVSDATGLPITFPYRLAIGLNTASIEIVYVTAGTGNTLTVTRGREDTASQVHSTGATVDHVATAADFQDAAAHIDATTNVHGVGAPSSVVGTQTTQTLTNKTMSGASNTFTAIPGSAITGAISGTIAVANVVGDWPIDTRSTGNLPIDTRTSGNLPIDTRSTGNLPITTRTTGNLPGSRVASPLVGPMVVTGALEVTTNLVVDNAINALAMDAFSMRAGDFVISSGERNVGTELNALNSPSRLSFYHGGFNVPNNSNTTVTGITVAKNVDSFSVNTGTGIIRVPKNGDYEILFRGTWAAPSGANTGGTILYVQVGGLTYEMLHVFSRGSEGSKAGGAGVIVNSITTSDDIYVFAFQNANGGGNLGTSFHASLKYIGP